MVVTVFSPLTYRNEKGFDIGGVIFPLLLFCYLFAGGMYAVPERCV